MKMKHWAYIGMALIDVNASLLGGVRAAELTQTPLVFHQPAFDYLRMRLGVPPANKPQKLTSPVTVHLFDGQKLAAVWLGSSSGFLVSNRMIEGPVLISLHAGQLEVYRGSEFQFSAPSLSVTSLDEKVFEVRAQSRLRRWTRGELEFRVINGRIRVVNRLELEDYVSGILEGELGTLKLPPEVLKAQAIVARTYVLSMRGERHGKEGYEFCDGPHCQVFSAIPHGDNAAVTVALAKVRGQYLTYHGHPIAAFYHHSCGGMTTAVQDVWPASPEPYLVPVSEGAGSFCQISSESKWYFGENRKSLATCFRKAHWLNAQEALDSIKVVRTDKSGRATTIMIQGNRTLLIPIGKFRNVINQYYGREVLMSSLFTITRTGEKFAFKGRGWGHGVGLCQEGAKSLARHGKTYTEILSHYFPHTKLSTLN